MFVSLSLAASRSHYKTEMRARKLTRIIFLQLLDVSAQSYTNTNARVAANQELGNFEDGYCYQFKSIMIDDCRYVCKSYCL